VEYSFSGFIPTNKQTNKQRSAMAEGAKKERKKARVLGLCSRAARI